MEKFEDRKPDAVGEVPTVREQFRSFSRRLVGLGSTRSRRQRLTDEQLEERLKQLGEEFQRVR